MIKKMRVQLYDNEGRLLSDRLVTQEPELAAGPKEKHEGPMRVEPTLMDSKDIEDFVTYLKRLSGNLPLRVVGTRGRKASGETPLDSTKAREIHFNEILKNIETTDQMATLDFLRKESYVLLTGEHIRLLDLQKIIKFKESDEDKYYFMIKRIKKAKDPKSDKYDPYIVLGISLDKPKKIVKLFRVGEKPLILKCKLSENPIKNIPSREVLKFPKHLNEDERLKFSIEHRKLLDNPELKKSKFYARWESSIGIGIRL